MFNSCINFITYRLLNEAKGSLLDDEQLVNTLQTSKTTSQEVSEQLTIAEQTEIKIDNAREGKSWTPYPPSAEAQVVLSLITYHSKRWPKSAGKVTGHSSDCRLMLFISYCMASTELFGCLSLQRSPLLGVPLSDMYNNLSQVVMLRYKLVYCFILFYRIQTVCFSSLYSILCTQWSG